ncbi:MAG: multiheme c-type cytochrome [Methyloprofundus sp.]|nr:multiheme c-type cytochrome [Methyloprofundus sp.]
MNDSVFTSDIGAVNEGDTVIVQLTSSPNEGALSNAILTIGSVSDTFSVLTINSTIIPIGSKGDPSFTSNHFSGSANCQMCHDGLVDNTGKDVSIVKAWKSTMMANATRDPLWKAKVRTELNRTPSLAGVINDKCSRCHAPMANFEAHQDNAPIEILDAGFTSANNAYHNNAMDGVSCTLCHQIADNGTLGTLEAKSGHYPIDTYANKVDRKIYGPYANVMANPMRMNVEYTPELGAHTKKSELCSTCHDLKTPYTDEAGNILSSTPESEFPEQMPYSEWLASDYAETTSCQQCHMARSNGVKISTRPMMLGARDDFAQHIFVGGNKFMLDMLNNNKDELGVIANDFQTIISATENLLAGAASIELLNSSQVAGALDFSVRVKSNTGHKLPSAYPSRRVILHVTVKDSLGNTVFESGKVNADGSVTGVDSDMDQTLFEPHYDVITSADQVQIYEAIMQDYQGNVTYTLLRGSDYLKDNRLLPNGFNKQTAPADVKVAGAAFDDANFIGGSDETRYTLSGLVPDNYSVSIELVYQTLAYGFAQDLFKDKAKEVTDFKRLYNASNAKSTIITSQNFVLMP